MKKLVIWPRKKVESGDVFEHGDDLGHECTEVSIAFVVDMDHGLIMVAQCQFSHVPM